MLETYKPRLEELGFRQALLADRETMSYNDAWGGTISFPEERWESWYCSWVEALESERYYRYVYDTAQVSFTVTAVYDPYTNALTTEVSGPSRPAVTNTKLSDAQRRKIRELKKQRVSLSRAKGKTSALKLRWKKVRFGKGKVSGYMVQICRNRKFRGSSLQTVSTTSTSLTVRNLTAGKNYYVRIRAYRKVGVKTFCSKWSEKRKVRIPGR